jgi:hypothetical protein
LDAFVTNTRSQPNKTWINQGGTQGGTAGTFSDSGQSLGSYSSYDVSLADVDGDGDLDAFVVNTYSGPDKVWMNQGGAQGGTAGTFIDSGQSLGNSWSAGVALGDVDGDGDLDAFVDNSANQPNKVWVNQGGAQGGATGTFSDSMQSLGNSNSWGIVLGDVDGDGDLDAFVANYNQPNKMWINQGGAQGGTAGTFSDSGQSLGSSVSVDVGLGDVDGDGDLDAFVTNYSQPNKVWLSNGGTFTDSGQSLGSWNSHSVALGDVDNDGDLDAFVANLSQANKVWRNEGGSAGLTVTDTSPAGISNATEDDLLKVVFTHNGIAADRNLELNKWNLDLLRSNCSTVLTTAEANAIIDRLRVRLDDGDDTFETDGSDVLISGGDIDTLSLTGGVQTVTFSNNDLNVQVDQDVTPARTYWISALTTADAQSQDPRSICLNFDPDAHALVEGKTPDFGVTIRDTRATNTGATPLPVTLSYFLATPSADGVHFAWSTATETGNAGFNLYAEMEAGRQRLNAELIPSAVIDSVESQDYAYETTDVAAEMFTIEQIDVSGDSELHGPFALGVAHGSRFGANPSEMDNQLYLPSVQKR